tara:strand:+ start:5064 stop:5300 length:237 start_codon:yes stop_codon:yes gene_type:complete
MALASFNAVKTVIETVLAPHSPTAVGIPTQGQALYMDGLIEQLEIIAFARSANGLHGNFPHANRAEKIQAGNAEQQHG